MKENKTPRKGLKSFLITVVVVLAIILLLVATAVIIINALLNKIPRENTLETLSQEVLESIENETDPDYTGSEDDASDVTMPTAPQETIQTDDIINVLLVGQDGDNTSGTSRSRSDSMILCTINKKEKTLTLTSFMRDMYVKIPGYYNQRINVAYLLGGFETAYDTLEYNFGVQVDQGVAVNFKSFEKVIDQVGGLDIYLTGAEAAYISKLIYNPKRVLKEGVNHLTGIEALTYARIRALDNDFVRTERQRNVIMTLVEKAKTLPLDTLYGVIESLLPMLITDMTNAQIVSCALELAPLLKDIRVVSQRIPADGTYRNAGVNGMSVLLPDLDANHQLLVDTIGIKDEKQGEE